MIATTLYGGIWAHEWMSEDEAGGLVVNHAERGFSVRRIDVDPAQPQSFRSDFLNDIAIFISL